MKFVQNNKILEDSNAEIAEISAEKKNRERERYTFGLARRSFRNVAAAGACGFLPGVSGRQ